MSDEFLVRDTRLARHFWADNEIVDNFGAQLGAHAFAVYMVLCRHAINHTGECRISTRKVGRQIGMSPQGVLNALNHLEQMGLARRLEAGDRTKPATFQLADVKALLDPAYAQLKLVGRVVHGVNPVDTSRSSGVNPVDTGVHPVDASVHPVDRASTGWTRNKEDKTSSRLKTKKTVCSRCKNTGTYELSGHPGEHVFCGCEVGTALAGSEKRGARHV